MAKARGYRSGTRYAFSRAHRRHGNLPMSVYLTQYRVGDVVDIVIDGATTKSNPPHKYYNGKTGVVFNVTKSSVGVIIYKIVGNRYLEKRVSVRVEHVRHSKCRQEFLDRVKLNYNRKVEARKNGERVQLKRLPVQPREARTVVFESPETVTPVPYETYI